MRWVYNAKPPYPDYEDKIFPGTNLTEAEHYKRQIEGKIIGDPQPVNNPGVGYLLAAGGKSYPIHQPFVSVEQLKAQGIVGVYEP